MVSVYKLSECVLCIGVLFLCFILIWLAILYSVYSRSYALSKLKKIFLISFYFDLFLLCPNVFFRY